MTRSRLHRSVQGSNQYSSKDRMLGLKTGTWCDIFWITLFVFCACQVFMRLADAERPIISPLSMTAYAQTDEQEPKKDPELAPLSERENNIRIIKKMWKRDWSIGVAIATCESGLRSTAFNGHNKNGTWDAGLFQVNTIHGWSKEELFDPIANAGIAYSKYVDQGTNPWRSSEHCWKDKI